MNLFFSHACDKKSPRTLGFHIKYHNSLNTHKCVILEKIKHHCKEKAMRLFQERGRLLEKEITVLEPSDARTRGRNHLLSQYQVFSVRCSVFPQRHFGQLYWQSISIVTKYDILNFRNCGSIAVVFHWTNNRTTTDIKYLLSWLSTVFQTELSTQHTGLLLTKLIQSWHHFTQQENK